MFNIFQILYNILFPNITFLTCQVGKCPVYFVSLFSTSLHLKGICFFAFLFVFRMNYLLSTPMSQAFCQGLTNKLVFITILLMRKLQSRKITCSRTQGSKTATSHISLPPLVCTSVLLPQVNPIFHTPPRVTLPTLIYEEDLHFGFSKSMCRGKMTVAQP